MYLYRYQRQKNRAAANSNRPVPTDPKTIPTLASQDSKLLLSSALAVAEVDAGLAATVVVCAIHCDRVMLKGVSETEQCDCMTSYVSARSVQRCELVRECGQRTSQCLGWSARAYPCASQIPRVSLGNALCRVCEEAASVGAEARIHFHRRTSTALGVFRGDVQTLDGTGRVV